MREAAFRRLALGRAASYFGDWLLAAALVGWLYHESGSLFAVSALMLVRLLPPVVAGGLAGAMLDRRRKERVLVAAEAATVAAIAVALVGVQTESPVLILTAGAVWGALATVVGVAVNALVPAVVPEERLTEANAVIGIAQESAMAAGALGAGVLLATAGAEAAVVLGGLAYATGVVLHRGIRVQQRAPVERVAEATQGLRAAVRYFRSRPNVVAVAAGFALATTATGLVNASLPRFMEQVGLGSGGYGLALGLLAIGLTIGEAATGAAAARMSIAWLGWSFAGMAALFVAFAHAGGPAAALLLLGAIGIADGVSEVVLVTALQRNVDAAYHGRVFGLTATLFRTTMMVAVGAAPLVNRLVAPEVAIEVGAFFLVLAAVVVLRDVRPLPIPESSPA